MRAGAFALIKNTNDKILLVHRKDKDEWNLPGGGVKLKESPKEGAIRETKEESGYLIKTTKLLGVVYRKKLNAIDFLFEGVIISGSPKLSNESDKIKFYDINNFPENIKPSRELICGLLENKDAFYIDM